MNAGLINYRRYRQFVADVLRRSYAGEALALVNAMLADVARARDSWDYDRIREFWVRPENQRCGIPSREVVIAVCQSSARRSAQWIARMFQVPKEYQRCQFTLPIRLDVPRTPLLLEMARDINDRGAWEELPILGDALTDADAPADFVVHCYDSFHGVGCAVLESILCC